MRMPKEKGNFHLECNRQQNCHYTQFGVTFWVCGVRRPDEIVYQVYILQLYNDIKIHKTKNLLRCVMLVDVSSKFPI